MSGNQRTEAGSCIRVSSQAGAPVRLADFRPVACESLVRIGSANDGGYVVPLVAVKAADALLSFGLSYDWTFERDFNKQNPRALIHCYDHTVSPLSAIAYSIGQMVRLLTRWNARYLSRAFTWIDYPIFFRGNRVHIRQRVWRDREHGSTTVEDAFARLPAGSRVFVKMDIEGSEYRVLDDLLRHSADIVAMAIEFHDVDILPELFSSMVEKIRRDFHLVHIHGNNWGGLAPFHFPIAPELTFLNKRFFSSEPGPSSLRYPIAQLDRPNNPAYPDYGLDF